MLYNSYLSSNVSYARPNSFGGIGHVFVTFLVMLFLLLPLIQEGSLSELQAKVTVQEELVNHLHCSKACPEK